MDSTEPLASSSSRLCSGPEEQFLDDAGAFTIMHEKNRNSRAIISQVLGG